MTRTFLSALPHSRKRFAALAFLLALFVLCCVQTGAQTTYADYPQKRGKTEGLAWNTLPSWMTLRLEVRSRTEGQTSLGYVQNGARIYDLTHALGSVEIRPGKYVTGYMQFIDDRALGLPLHVVASNMRDGFDLRQGWLNVHAAAGRVPFKDNLYADSGVVVIKARTAGFASGVIGQEFDVSGKYVFHDDLVANVGVGHLFPGALLLQNKHGAAETIGYFGLTYRLRVDQVKADR